RLRLAELHHAASAALHRGEEEPEDDADEQERDEDAEQAREPVGLGHLVVELGLRGRDRLDDRVAARGDVVELHLGAELDALDDVGLGEREVDALRAVDDLDRLDGVATEQFEALLGGDRAEADAVSRLKPMMRMTAPRMT